MQIFISSFLTVVKAGYDPTTTTIQSFFTFYESITPDQM